MSGPLSGVRILDLTHVILGPYATQQLADLGADVIKVEALQGDPLREIGPARHPGMGPIFLHLNRNKRSLALDLKHPRGREALLKLVTSADVFTCNMRRQAMDRLGLTWPALEKVNPRLIYATMSGFSKKGPYADEAAYDDIIQAAVALPSAFLLSGDTTPRFVPTPIADRAVGLYAMGIICAALYAREITGKGDCVDIPMFETMAQFVLGDHMYGHTFSPPLGEFGYPRLLSRGRRPYATRDGYIACLVYTDDHWRFFAKAFQLPTPVAADQRFGSMSSRIDHIDEFYRLVAATLENHTTSEILRRLGGHVPAFPLHRFDTLVEDPHLGAIGFIQEEDHPSEGRLKRLGEPAEWTNAKLSHRYPAPRLGEHSREILSEVGVAPEEIDGLIESGLVRQAPPITS